MTVHAPVHPERSHELLDDVIGEEGASRSQRVIGWLCALLTAALAVAAWRLL